MYVCTTTRPNYTSKNKHIPHQLQWTSWSVGQNPNFRRWKKVTDRGPAIPLKTRIFPTNFNGHQWDKNLNFQVWKKMSTGKENSTFDFVGHWQCCCLHGGSTFYQTGPPWCLKRVYLFTHRSGTFSILLYIYVFFGQHSIFLAGKRVYWWRKTIREPVPKLIPRHITCNIARAELDALWCSKQNICSHSQSEART